MFDNNNHIVLYHDDGKTIKSYKEFYFEQKHGKCIEYYKNGNIASYCMYFQNNPTGPLLEFHQNGNLKRKVKFFLGKKNGKYREYYPNGILFKKFNFRNGLMHGKQYSFFESGNIKKVEHYFNGLSIGKHVSYHENNRIDTIWFYNGNNKLHGYKKKYYKNGNLHSIAYYENGELNGDISEYHENGIMKRYKEFSSKNYISHISTYYDNGAIMKSYTLDKYGKKDKKSQLYDKFGNKIYTIVYRDGKKHGPYEIFHQNRLQFLLHFRNDKLQNFQYKVDKKGFYRKTFFMMQNKLILQKESNDNDSCCICYDTSAWFTYPCHHCLCLSCTKSYLANTDEIRCPYCRQNFPSFSKKKLLQIL